MSNLILNVRELIKFSSYPQRYQCTIDSEFSFILSIRELTERRLWIQDFQTMLVRKNRLNYSVELTHMNGLSYVVSDELQTCIPITDVIHPSSFVDRRMYLINH